MLEGDLPTPRAGHSLVYNPNTQKCYMFGGANHEQGHLGEIYGFEPELAKWSKIQLFSSLKSPAERYEHVCLLIDSDTMMVMYGAGLDGPLDDIWKWSLETGEWTVVETNGTKPSARVIRSVGFVSSKNRVYLFGGGLHNNIPVPDPSTYCFDLGNPSLLDRLFWCKVNSQGPSTRLGHCIVSDGSKLYLSGGMDKNQVFGDVWEFDTNTNKWLQLDIQLLPRCAHQMVFYENKLYITGGMDPNPPQVFDILEMIDVTTAKLESRSIDIKRLDHTMTVVGDKILIAGGMDLQHVFLDDRLLLPDGNLV
jgi:N-acetylneuraminic acid mutarotase